ncbi:hypothetical protein SERLADRAFT_350499 [Serpula lacrymans var. lacrymans S7.9]|uniref:ZW10 C-terminal helical domain-containing protein n=1 Tax=Serpula lacrymans var. lacrymans (strain S7.9) TaxID=578457 RepID=F8P2P7_SERL9|nr:uncharacterized protein SERLADRAFT_350499 [Serpula lacrymans var. lacrymans S7.9]EGO22432.1 hypothetical protein SERLADRAFT_350499 [Serpula lacrymans var. lacrymans S7.9]
MALPIPTNLPRQEDVISKILAKLDGATYESLNASIVVSWRVELDEAIRLNEKQLHDRIHGDAVEFEQQLTSAKEIQVGLQSLSENIDSLDKSVSDPESGIIPVLIRNLTAHQTLAQESLNADTLYRSLLHLSDCRTELLSLQSLVDEGNLPRAAKSCEALQHLLDTAPSPLDKAKIFQVIKFVIRPSIHAPQSNISYSLSDVFASLSANSAISHLTTLRRDVLAHYIDYTLSQPTSVTVKTEIEFTGTSFHKLSHVPSPPNTENLLTRLDNLAAVLDFLKQYLLPSLPISQKESFPKSLCKPMGSAILTHLLEPSLPSSLHLLPPFLNLTKKAVRFEEDHIVGVLGGASNNRDIKSWVDGVSGHYERQRRLSILEAARTIIVEIDETSSTFHAETISAQEVNDEISQIPATSDTEGGDAWNLDDDKKSTGNASSIQDESGWSFEDDVIGVEPESTDGSNVPPPQSTKVQSTDDVDPGDAWGWNDDEEPLVDDENAEETVWDDPWSDAPSEISVPARPPAAPSITSVPTETVTRPDNFAAMNSHSSSAASGLEVRQAVDSRHTRSGSRSAIKEVYLVSSRTRSIIRIVENALQEGKELISSGIFSYSPTSTSLPGTLILQSAIQVLNLFRALYTVTFSPRLAQSEQSMLFSNDCFYLSEEIARIATYERGLLTVKEELVECRDTMKLLSDSWFHDSIDQCKRSIEVILSKAEGFTETADQDRFDECEGAITQPVLAKSKFYMALGYAVESALSNILDDILALPDIPEVESHRLSELCKILNSLEGLFVEDTSLSSFVVSYVSSWLKFSYLSELLEASMADITYLFEEGALVDFEVDELVKLVRALFADTPLRTTTVNKILGGHPVRQ